MADEPSVSCEHKLHFHLIPPDTHVHHGFIYALHCAQRAGPLVPVSITGTGSSRGLSSAKGWSIAAIGTLQSDTSLDVLGMFHVDTRINLGEEFPAESTVSEIRCSSVNSKYLGQLQ